MDYISRNLLGDEKVIFLTKKSYVIFFIPLVCTIIALISIPFMSGNPILRNLAFIPWLVALIFWVYFGLEYWTAEFAVTNQRILMKEGFFYRHASDIRLDSISQLNIQQDPIGQLLNYGSVTINAFGAYDDYSMLNKPQEFNKAVSEQMYRIRNRA